MVRDTNYKIKKTHELVQTVMHLQEEPVELEKVEDQILEENYFSPTFEDARPLPQVIKCDLMELPEPKEEAKVF